MSKMVWLLGLNEKYRTELKSFLSQEVKYKLFANPDKALADLERERPDILISKEDTVLPLLAAPYPLADVLVIVTADDPCFDKAYLALEKGVNDLVYHETPISIMAAKIKYCLRSQGSARCLLLQDCKIDNVYRKITTAKGRAATFTSKEFQIVMAFSRREPPVITRHDLIDEVWGGVKVGQKTLDVHLFNIRKKIAAIQLEIRFEAPNSYRLCSLKQNVGSARALAAHSSNIS